MKHALRSLAKSPAHSVVAILVVALGIGAATAMFSTVNALVLRPLALPEPERLAVVYETQLERGIAQFSVSLPNYADWRERSRSWASLAAVAGRSMNLSGEGEPELLRVSAVTENLLPTLGLAPALGRNFLLEEDRPGAARVAILSGAFWQRRFGGARGVLGQTLTLDGASFTIVGVTPAGAPVPFEFDVLVPLAMDVAREDRMNHYSDVIGRLAPGVTLAQADAEMKALAAQIFAELPGEDRGWSTTLVPLEREVVGSDVRRGIYVLLGAVGLLLLIACANLSNLILIRATARGHELAVRVALGAGRWRIVRQLVAESLLLTGAGGVAGLLLLGWVLDLLRALPLPRASEISADPRVLAVACGATLLTGLLAGAGPALTASQQRPQEALKGHAPRAGRRSRLRDGMVVAQIALSLVLLVSATLCGRSFRRLMRVQPGFDPEQVLTLALRPVTNRVQFYDAVERAVARLPGVEKVGFISRLPLTAGNTQNDIYAVGSPVRPAGKAVQASWRLVHGDYFGAMQIPLLRGQDFRALTPAEARQSMVISAALARAMWGEADPIGRQIRRIDSLFTVIGVVGDVRGQQLGTEAMPAFYMSVHRMTYGYQAMVVRTSGEPAALAPLLRQTIRQVDPTAPIFELRTMEDVRAASLRQEKLVMGLLAGFAAAAWLLAALGTYGVVAFSVQQRTPEIGIRLAIGAQTGDVLRLIVGQGARLAAGGLLFGLAGALAVTRLLGAQLYETSTSDGTSYVLAALALLAAALFAAWLPARRAARIDPVSALRAE